MAAPANDNFANAQLLSGNSGSFGPVDITDATIEAGEPPNPDAGRINQSIWFKWVPSADDEATIDTLGSHDDGNGQDLDTVLAIWTGDSLINLIAVTSNDDTTGTVNSSVSWLASAGTTYWIQAGTYFGSRTGTIILNWNLATPPPPPPPITLSIAEAIDVPFKTYTGGLIAVRAYDFVAPLRSGLSVIDDPDSRVGRVVRESQQVVPVEYPSAPGDIDQQNTYLAAQDTIVIPFDDIGITDIRPYVIYVRFKATGGPDSVRKYASGVLAYGFETFIGIRMIAGTDSYAVSTPFKRIQKLPFWSLIGMANNQSAISGNSFFLRALTSTTNNVVFEIDQIFFVPQSSYTTGSTVEGAGQSMDYVYGDGSSVEDDDPFAGGIFSTQADALWGRTGYTGSESGDYQQKSSYADAEFSDVEIGNQGGWDDQSEMYIIGVGPSWVPTIEVVEDTFNRTVSNGWGVVDYWPWQTQSTFIPIANVAPGVASIQGSGDTSYIFMMAFGNGNPANYTYKDQDFDVTNGCKIEADLSCDTPSAESYMALLGYGDISTGVGGNERFFVGLAIVKESDGSESAVLVEYSSSSAISPHWVELCPRVSVPSGIHTGVTIERKSQYLEAHIEGHTLTGHIAGQFWGGGYPYPWREWIYYPYTSSPENVPAPYSFYGVDPRYQGSYLCFADASSSTTTKSYCYRFKVTIEGYSTVPPTASSFGLEPQDGHASPKWIEVPWGAMHVIVASNEYYGDIGYDTIKNWRTKWWLPQGSPDTALAVVNHYWFEQLLNPPTTIPSILWFFKDGVWRNASVDTEYDLHYYSNGSWHVTSEGLQGFLSGTWQI